MEISSWCGYRSLTAVFSSPYCSAKSPSSLSLSLSSSSSAFFASCGGGTRATRGPTGQSLVSVVPRRRKGRSTTIRCLFGLGVPELVVIAGVAALVFGPKQLPEVGRNVGKTIKSFQQAAKEFEAELKKEREDKSDESPPTEIPKTVGNGDEKELEPSGTKDIV